jgi:hypothetical protein
MKSTHTALLLLSLLSLVACGGGASGGGGPPLTASDADGDGVVDTADCAPSNAEQWRNLAFASRDEDGDGFRVNAEGILCSGHSLPSTRFVEKVPTESIDCSDSDHSVWSLLEYGARDADQDGYSVVEEGSVCSGQSLPLGYASSPSSQLDCDDTADARWRWMGIYTDRDGDGVGSGAVDTSCVGSVAPAGYALTGYDPLDDPSDPTSLITSSFDLNPALLVRAGR